MMLRDNEASADGEITKLKRLWKLHNASNSSAGVLFELESCRLLPERLLHKRFNCRVCRGFFVADAGLTIIDR